MSFAPSIIHLTDDFDVRNFPKQFSNQVYFSSLTSFEPYAYHSNFSIKFTLHGTETYIVNGQKSKLRKNQILIVNPGSFVEGFHDMTGNSCQGLSVFLEPELISEVYSNTGYLSRNEVPETSPTALAPLEFHERIISDDDVLPGFLSSLGDLRFTNPLLEAGHYVAIAEALVDFKSRFERRLRQTKKIRRSTQVEIVERVARAKQFMDDSVSTPFYLDLVARASCMSKYLLVRCFKSVYGLTPQQYHSLRRIDKAKTLLRAGLSVTETSARMGYPSIFYFSRQFKRITGQSPRHTILR